LERSISIRGARTNNLRDIDLDLPLEQITVVTGVSGSGKSSLVFDTLYAEGQRRYVQSLSTYARLFLERMDRPDVDSISDIPPALALRQKNSIKNARSTVGSITEIGDYLRLLFATIGRTICPQCQVEVGRDTVDTIAARLLAQPAPYLILAPYSFGSRTAAQALAYLAKNGYHRLFVNHAAVELREVAPAQLENEVEVVVDRVVVAAEDSGERVREAIEKALYLGEHRASAVRMERGTEGMRAGARLDFDTRFNCSSCGRHFPEPSPAMLSPNSPIGACQACEGFGRTMELDLDKVIPNHNRSLRQDLVAPWRTPAYREMHNWMVECARRRRIRLSAPYSEFTPEERSWLLDGEGTAAEPGSTEKRARRPRGLHRGPHERGHHHHHHHHNHHHEWHSEHDRWPGIRGFFRWLERRRYKTHVRILLAKYRRFVTCTTCGGAKLKPEAFHLRVAGKHIAEVSQMPIGELAGWLEGLKLVGSERARVASVVRELRSRVNYLVAVGLDYLVLERSARTLSGGEAQRIHLASALGSLLTGTLYVLDEPTVGLHARDSRRLLQVLRQLRDLGNTVVVVEHDPIIIAGADRLVELGPAGGREGGHLLANRAPPRRAGSAKLARAVLMRAIARERHRSAGDPVLRIVGAREHNLRDLDVSIPLRRLVCVSGVSGSGKSTLVEEVLYNNYLQRMGQPVAGEVGACRALEGLQHLDRIVHLGQETLLRSSRSNPATYVKIYDHLRKLMAATAEARRLGIQARDFSFNVVGGRCERCQGMGTVTLEMHFMADLEVKCEACDGRRFQSHVLGVSYHGLNINQILALTVDEARSFFAGRASIVSPLDTLSAVGLGYLQLGQATSTLSGGEAQRLRLASFLDEGLNPRQQRKSLFILDEPTTGLSSSDVRTLLRVLVRLVDEGYSLLVIEHNLELIAHADHVIDLGPEGGADGGRLVAEGTPLEVAGCAQSHTGRELRRLFGLPLKARPAAIRAGARQAAGL
jgi:excinuclease ABC subunit A